MKVRLFEDDPDHTINGELVLVEYDASGNPVLAIVQESDGSCSGFDFGHNHAGEVFYLSTDLPCIVLETWTITEQYPANERHSIYTTLRLNAENGASLDAHRLELMGWRLLTAPPSNPFDGAECAVFNFCETCQDTFAEGYDCEHLLARFRPGLIDTSGEQVVEAEDYDDELEGIMVYVEHVPQVLNHLAVAIERRHPEIAEAVHAAARSTAARYSRDDL